MSSKITVADTAGFCFGVKRAVNMVLEACKDGKCVCTLGPIIHNNQMVDELKEKGVDVIEDPYQSNGRTVAIRAHGVAKNIYDYMIENNISYIDATCPYVKQIHKLVENIPKEALVIIAGDVNHPEVKGIIGHSKAKIIVISKSEEIISFEKTFKNNEKELYLLAQTTFNTKEWEKCVFEIKKVYTNVKIFDTICNATSLRQQEAARLAENADAIIVIGGKHSSNTQKLTSICSELCRTIAVETAIELDEIVFSGIRTLAITAGASTPVGIIKEVHETMSEILENQDPDQELEQSPEQNLEQDQDQEELSFEEMLDQSFKSTYNGEKVTAVVTGIAPNEISVDIGTKHAGYVPLHELTDDPNAKPEDIVSKGDELELLVIRVNDVEGTVMLSKKRLDAQAGFEKVMGAAETEEILEGVITEVIKGGVLALTSGVKVFIPASQATLTRNEPLEGLLRKEVSFKILEVNRQRRRAVGSIRAVARDQRRVIEEKFWETLVIGDQYDGVVKSLADYGAFIDLGGVDGMVHISELSWGKIRHPSQVLKVGDNVNVFVKNLDPEKKKISLGYKRDEDNPWTILKAKYEVGNVTTVKVVSLTAFGAFAELMPGIDGLIHISQISNERVGKPSDVLSVGQEVDVKITEIDFVNRRISLSARAVIEDRTSLEEAAVVEEAKPTKEATE